MAIRTIAELKSYFQGVPTADTPTAEQWTDLFDSIQWYYDMVNAALAAASSVVLVPDQLTMLTNGPTYAIGRRIKQTDEGITWVKQRNPGTSIEDYAPIADVEITIPDVIGLPAALDARFVIDGDGQSNYRIGVRNTRCVAPDQWGMIDGAPISVRPWSGGSSLNYGAIALSKNAELVWIPNGGGAGRSTSAFLYNDAVSPIEIALTANMIGTNGTWPIVLDPGKWVQVTLSAIIIPNLGFRVLAAFNQQL